MLKARQTKDILEHMFGLVKVFIKTGEKEDWRLMIWDCGLGNGIKGGWEEEGYEFSPKWRRQILPIGWM
jgi:hypothetical protein